MKIFISYSILESDLYLITLFLEKLREQGHKVETSNLQDETSLFRQQRDEYRISNADVFIGIAAFGGDNLEKVLKDHVLSKKSNVEKILLVERGVNLKIKEPEYFEFDRFKMDIQVNTLLENSEILKTITREIRERLVIAITALLLALGNLNLVDKDEEKNNSTFSSVLLLLNRWKEYVLPRKKTQSNENSFQEKILVVISHVREAKLLHEYIDQFANKKVVGFFSGSKEKIKINGVSTFDLEDIEEFINDHSVNTVVLPYNKLSSVFEKKLINQCLENNISVYRQINFKYQSNSIGNIPLQRVEIEDLLDNSLGEIQSPKITEELDNKTILVTGGAGAIGQKIVLNISEFNYKSLIIIDQAEASLQNLQEELRHNGHHNFITVVGDVRDKNRMNEIFAEYKPQTVFHLASYNSVPLMEYNSYEAIKINVAGTKTLSDLSLSHNVEKFVFISTDKAVNPTNVMGASKRIAEMYISCLEQERMTKFITVRFGNIIGSDGSAISLFKKQIDKGGPLTVTHKEITRYFMTISEASQLVLEAAAMGQGGEIFIFDMGEPVKIFDLAKNMIKLLGLKYPEDIDIKITGLRPGEKLYEELLANGENTLPTYHEKIMISKVKDINHEEVKNKVDELCVSNMFLRGDILKLMKEIVPEYISKNSQYSDLDEDKREKSSLKLKEIERSIREKN